MEKRFWMSCLAMVLWLWGGQAMAHQPIMTFQDMFEEAYQAYPHVPRGMLEAVAWTNTRMRHVRPDLEAPSCAGLPASYGIMGLVADGQGYFNNNLTMVSVLSGKSVQMIVDDPHQHILAYAAAFDYLARSIQADPADPTSALPVLEVLSEIPEQAQGVNNFALNSHLYSVLRFLNDSEQQERFRFPHYQLNLEQVFGAENYRVLSASSVTIAGDEVHAGRHQYQPLPVPILSPDYPPALWNPAASCNYSSRSGTPISAVTIHTVQGSYSGAISWFQNCNASVSAHYVVRSSDGQVTQMVLESDKAWHVGTENPYTIGIEHEGYVADAAWYTNELYAAAADLVTDIVNSGYGINPLQTWFGAPTAGLQVLPTNCYRIKGHQHFPNQSHVDPGINWDWDRFYRMLNGAAPTTTLSACSGTLYDGGGAGGNYADQERQGWVIAPAGAEEISLSFSSFDLEAGYDYLYIYDGADDQGEFLGKFDGQSIPGPFTARSGKFYLELRSDCATNRPGFAANWSCTTTPPACGEPSALQVSNLHGMGATLGWTGGGGATSYEVRVRHSLSTTWETYSASGTSLDVTGLKASSLYYWQVRTLCGATQSPWVGADFSTPSPSNHTYTACSGTFRDSGGNLANYRNYEDYTVTISPAGASAVTLSFSSFDLEANYDYLYLYDGPTDASPLIGTYTSTNSPGTITSTGGSLTIKFTSDSWTTRTGWEATWTCVNNLAPLTAIAPLSEWQTGDFTATFTDTDQNQSGIEWRFYQVLDRDTSWGCNRDNGFVYEDFDGGFPNWTLHAGNAYILNDRLHQTDTVQTNSNTYLDVVQTGSGAWLYTFSARLWSGGAALNRRFGIHIFSDNPTATNRGNSYLIWFRGDDQQVQIYETINDALNTRVTQPLQIGDFVWYDYKVLYDPASGLIEVYQDNALVATWTDTTPLQSGSHISLRTNEAHMDYENVRVWKERGTTALISIGPAGTNDCRYQSSDPGEWAGQINALSQDQSNNWSNEDFKPFKIDWTPPAAITAADGLAGNLDTTYQDTSLAANWTASSDVNSAIDHYEWALGSSPGATDVMGFVPLGDTLSAQVAGLSLTHNQLYYATVRAVNGAGLASPDAQSDGVLVWYPPVSSAAPVPLQVLAFPNPAATAFQLRFSHPVSGTLRLFNGLGQVVGSRQLADQDGLRWDVAKLARGVYILDIQLADGQHFSQRMVLR